MKPKDFRRADTTIRNVVLGVREHMDYRTQKEGTEYMNIEFGDEAVKAFEELYLCEREERQKQDETDK